MFVAMGLSAVFPVIHGMKMYGIENMRDRIGLSWLVLQGALYILGAGLYAVSEWSARILIPLTITGSMARKIISWLV
jgi:adiponectin receptor